MTKNQNWHKEDNKNSSKKPEREFSAPSKKEEMPQRSYKNEADKSGR